MHAACRLSSHCGQQSVRPQSNWSALAGPFEADIQDGGALLVVFLQLLSAVRHMVFPLERNARRCHQKAETNAYYFVGSGSG